MAPSRTEATRLPASSASVCSSRRAAPCWSPRATRACRWASVVCGRSSSASSSRRARTTRACSAASEVRSRPWPASRRTSSSASPTTSSRSWTRRVGTRIESPERRPVGVRFGIGRGLQPRHRDRVVAGAGAVERGDHGRQLARARPGGHAPGRDRLMLSAATSSRSTRSLRTAIRLSRRAPSRSSARCATSTTPSSPSIRAEPLTVWASRNSPLTSWRGDGWLSSRSRPSHSEASRSSTSARKVATSSGSSAQPMVRRPGTARSRSAARRRAR